MADFLYYDLSGGLNLECSKTNAGLNPKKLPWSDSKNVEIYKNTGICSMKGNKLVFEAFESIVSMVAYCFNGENAIIYNTSAGNLYFLDLNLGQSRVLKTGISSCARLSSVEFCGGVVLSNGVDDLMYFVKGATPEIQPCNAIRDGKIIRGTAIAAYKGRLFVGSASTLYYSALGRFNDWNTAEDAGFIADFYNNSDEITAIVPYISYLAVYKKKAVYLLTGSNYSDFAIQPFADKGAVSQSSVVTVENNQYFVDGGVYSLEQVGELNQIRLSAEYSRPVHSLFSAVSTQYLTNILSIPYNKKFQIWYFLPNKYDGYINTVMIYDYYNKAWFKRVITQNITSACFLNGCIYTSAADGKIFIEDSGYTYNGEIIDFYWESPFLSFNSPNTQKSIEAFYLTLDNLFDNNFRLLIKKDYISNQIDDSETVKEVDSETLIWNESVWSINNTSFFWANELENVYVTNISGYPKSVQICIDSNTKNPAFSLLGFEFKDVIPED